MFIYRQKIERTFLVLCCGLWAGLVSAFLDFFLLVNLFPPTQVIGSEAGRLGIEKLSLRTESSCRLSIQYVTADHKRWHNKGFGIK